MLQKCCVYLIMTIKIEQSIFKMIVCIYFVTFNLWTILQYYISAHTYTYVRVFMQWIFGTIEFVVFLLLCYYESLIWNENNYSHWKKSQGYWRPMVYEKSLREQSIYLADFLHLCCFLIEEGFFFSISEWIFE